ncbi:LuxR C-terminal-related transcriptional regulator [Fusibacter ferrireducens]|uniref:HTH luxR-type domain-containing protein n=1 Tax=Fusibacter ferrireducens TaxID=2785058 RepID=A0ABR9ZSA5_9FIRM|nr:LuxR C-terminal-related transcriptional regulator [Fusibacter ferrireducens]MBF4693343.1 hypothetical protein [Fusibacter ferrireducens]
MEPFIIPSKLNKPRLERHFIERAPLIDRMNREGIAWITVSCQTGFGKSTLVSQWLDTHNKEAYVWYALDAYDDDIQVFLTYFAHGIQRRDEAIGNQLLNLLSQFHMTKPDRFFRMYISVLYGLETPIQFVVDDFQWITDQAILDFINLVMMFLMDQITVVIISREKIPLNLNKIRLSGHLLELTDREMKLDRIEIQAMISQANGFDSLNDFECSVESSIGRSESIYALTEGWIAGVQLILMASKGSRSQIYDQKDLARNHGQLSAYLIGTILKSLAPKQRDFLMLSAIPDSFSADMCDEVFEHFLKESKKWMWEIIDKNMFVMALDSEGNKFRYHHMFRNAILSHLKNQIGADYDTRFNGVMLAVAEWHMTSENYYEASRIFMKQSAYHKAAVCLEYLWAPMDLNLTSGIWLEMIDELPERFILDKPVLSMCYGWALIDNNRIEKAEFWLDNAQKIYEKESLKVLKKKELIADVQQYDLFEIHILMARAYIAAAEGNLEALFYYGNSAKNAMAHKNLKKHGVIMMTLAFAYWNQKDYKRAAECIEKGIQYERKYGEAINVDNYWMVLFHLWLHIGEFSLLDHKAQELIDDMESDRRLPIILPTLYLILAYSAYKQNHIDQCKSLMKKAKNIGGKLAINDFEYRYWMLKTKLCLDQEALSKAKLYLEAAKEQYFPNPIPDLYTIEQLESEIKKHESGTKVTSHWNAQLREPLTLREMEVLELIECGLSNKEIGQRLFIALSTVKGYIQNIYGKLEVKRRTEAVAKAKALNLL